ncbi:MAG TPA: response regulator [Aggregatilineales bacterium]|nr:response regulator [Aggregatilineales bacterium]
MLLAQKHIFIVEDNRQNRVVFKMALIRHGALVEFEKWGHDSAQRLKELAQADLVILDLMLAYGISGLDVFDEIRAIPRFQQVPIIAVSAMDPALAIPKVQLKGFAAFIAKPIDIATFPEQVARVMSGERLWASAVAPVSEYPAEHQNTEK